MSTGTHIEWNSAGIAPIGDELGPIMIETATVNGMTITRQRARGTTRNTWTVDNTRYRTLTAAIAATEHPEAPPTS